MTKRELIEALANVGDDDTVYLETDPEGDLFEVQAVRVFGEDGPDGPAFVVLAAEE